MKQPIKKGASPTKQNVVAKNPSAIADLLRNDQSLLDVPSDCKDELAKKGLVPRWIDIVELERNHGIHKKGWQPYKFECALPGASNPFGQKAGTYDGYLIRNRLVLGVKTTEVAARDKARIQLRTKMQSDPSAMKKQELQDFARQAGVNVKITGNEDMADDE